MKKTRLPLSIVLSETGLTAWQNTRPQQYEGKEQQSLTITGMPEKAKHHFIRSSP